MTARAPAASLALAGAIAAMIPAAAQATPDEIVRVEVRAPTLVAARRAFPIDFTVNADAGALDIRQAPVRLRVRFAARCGAFFDATPGPILLDRILAPQPTSGRPYAVSVATRGFLTAPGSYTICAYLEQFGDDRVFANDTDSQVNVTSAVATPPSRCRLAQARVARVKRSLHAARSSRRRAALRRRLTRLRRAAAVACRPRVNRKAHRHHHRRRARPKLR